MPTHTLTFEKEQKASGYKSSKECLTIMTCNSTTGTHKLKLLVIGKSRKPRCFKVPRAENLPVHYFNQKKVWMDHKTFKKWFKEKFIPLIREHLKSQNLPKKVVLLINNALSRTVFKSEEGSFLYIFCLPVLQLLYRLWTRI